MRILRGNTSAIVAAATTATPVCVRVRACALVSRRIPTYERYQRRRECSRIATRFTYL